MFVEDLDSIAEGAFPRFGSQLFSEDLEAYAPLIKPSRLLVIYWVPAMS